MDIINILIIHYTAVAKELLERLAVIEKVKTLQQLFGMIQNEEAVEQHGRTFGQLRAPSSCQSECKNEGKNKWKIIGTAPFCGASCDDCSGGGEECLSADYRQLSDYGAACFTGQKVCCCSN